MKTLNKIVLYGSALIFATSALSQTDRNFSMFYEEIPTLNPSAAGAMNEDIRIYTNYRRQWRNLGIDPYKTFQFSVDGKLHPRSNTDSYLGYGISAYSDHLPESSQINRINASLAAGLKVNDISYVSAGIGLAYGQMKYDNALLYSTQWNGLGFDNALPSGESAVRMQANYFDIGVGTYFRLQDNLNTFYAGVSALHLNKPNITYTNQHEALYSRFILQLGGSLLVSGSKLALEPNGILLNQGPNTVISIGNNFRYYLSSASTRLSLVANSSVHAGLFYRSRDGVFITLGYVYDMFSISGSWDISTSNLGPARAFELLLKAKIYFNKSTNRFRN